MARQIVRGAPRNSRVHAARAERVTVKKVKLLLQEIEFIVPSATRGHQISQATQLEAKCKKSHLSSYLNEEEAGIIAGNIYTNLMIGLS